jgi:hypothetical protein
MQMEGGNRHEEGEGFQEESRPDKLQVATYYLKQNAR